MSPRVVAKYTYLLCTPEGAHRKIRVIELEGCACSTRNITPSSVGGKERIIYWSVVLNVGLTDRLQDYIGITTEHLWDRVPAGVIRKRV
jgi:hypothetical protein